ncbi:MAG: hypothetical protein WCY59_07025, partial [Anaerovoracaceae bacterium]
GDASEIFSKSSYDVAVAKYAASIAQAQAQSAVRSAKAGMLTDEEKQIVDFYNSSGKGGVFGAPSEFKPANYTVNDLIRAQAELGQATAEFKAYSRTQANMEDIENWNKMVDSLVTKSSTRIDPSDHYAYDKMKIAAAEEKASFQAAQRQINADAYLPDWVYEARQEGRQAVLEGKPVGQLQDFGNLFTPGAYQNRFEQYVPKAGAMPLDQFISGSTAAAAQFMGERPGVGSRSVVYLNDQPYFYTSYGSKGYELRDAAGQIRSAGSGNVPLEQIKQEVDKVKDSPKSKIISPTLNILYKDVQSQYPSGEPRGIISSYDALFHPERAVQVGVGALSRYTDTGISTVEGAIAVRDIASRISSVNTRDAGLQTSLQGIQTSMNNYIAQHPGQTPVDDPRAQDIAMKRAILTPALLSGTLSNPMLMGFAGDVAHAGGESLARFWRTLEHPEEYGKGAFADYSITMPIMSRIGEKREKVTSGEAFAPATAAITTGWDQFVRAHAVHFPVSVREGAKQFGRAHEPIIRDASSLGGQVYEGVSAIPFGVAGFVASIPTGIEYVASRTLTGGIPGGIGAVKTGGKTVVDSTIQAFREKPIATAIEMYGTGKVLTPVFKGVPVKPALHTAKLGDSSFYSLGLMRSNGVVETAIPIIGVRTTTKAVPKTTKTTPIEYPTGDYYPSIPPSEPSIGVFVGHPKIRDLNAVLGDDVATIITPFESSIVSRLSPEERLKIDLARDVRTQTQHSGLRPHDMRGVIEEVVQQHNIPNHKQVADTILKTLVEDEAEVYGSIVQRQVGTETGRVGLLRVPRDIDAMVTDIDAFGALIVKRINQKAGREVVKYEDGAVIVKKSGEKLFDLHAKDAADTTTLGGSSRWIGLGIRNEPTIKIRYKFNDGVRGNLITTTLSEQATRKAVGSAFTVSAKPRVMKTELTGTVKGRIMPEKEGRLKDIGDYYTAERLNLARMKLMGNKKVGNVETKLESWLDEWGNDVATSVRTQYADAVAAQSGKIHLASFSTPRGVKSPMVAPLPTVASPSSSRPASIISRPIMGITSRALTFSPARSISKSVGARSSSRSPSPSRSSSPSRSPSMSLSVSPVISPSIKSPSLSPSRMKSPSISPSISPSRS